MGAEHHRTCVEGKKTGGSVASSSFTQPNASPPPSPLFSSFHLSSISLVSSLFPLFVVSCPFPPSPLQSFLSPPTSPFVYFWGIGVCVLCCMFKDSPFPHLFPLGGANHKTVVATFVQRFLLPPPLPPPPIHSEAFIPFLPLFSREMCVQCVYPISGLGQVEHNIMGGLLLPFFPLHQIPVRLMLKRWSFSSGVDFDCAKSSRWFFKKEELCA